MVRIDEEDVDSDIRSPPQTGRPKKKRALIEFGNQKNNAWNTPLFGDNQVHTEATSQTQFPSIEGASATDTTSVTATTSISEFSKDIAFLQADFNKAIQQENLKRQQDNEKFDKKLEVEKKEKTLAMEELRAFVKTTVRQQDEVFELLKQGQKQNDESIKQLRESFSSRSSDLQSSVDSLTNLVSQLSHQIREISEGSTSKISLISPLGKRWGNNGSQLHHNIPDYTNKKVTEEIQRQREAIMASEAFAKELANNPTSFQDDMEVEPGTKFNSDNMIRVDGSGEN